MVPMTQRISNKWLVAFILVGIAVVHNLIPVPSIASENYRQLASDDSSSHDPSPPGHYVTLYIGKSQSVVLEVDLKHEYTTFPCTKCTNCGNNHVDKPFNAFASSTASVRQCKDHCKFTTSTCIHDQNECQSLVYMDGEHGTTDGYKGIEVQDLVFLDTSDGLSGNWRKKHNLTFLCQETIVGLTRDSRVDGVMGLANSPYSLVSQFYNDGYMNKKQFSMCFSEGDEDSAGSIHLGDFDRSQHNTPLVWALNTASKESLSTYAINIRGMYVGLGGGSEPLLRASQGTMTLFPIQGQDGDHTSKVAGQQGNTFLESKGEETVLDQHFRISFEEAFKEMVGYPYLVSGIPLKKEDEFRFPTIFLQIEAYTAVQSYATSYDIPGLVGRHDTTHPFDVLLAIPPEQYLTYHDKLGTYIPCLGFQTDGFTQIGWRALAKHEVVFDMENARIGFAERKACTSSLKVAAKVGRSALWAKYDKTKKMGASIAKFHGPDWKPTTGTGAQSVASKLIDENRNTQATQYVGPAFLPQNQAQPMITSEGRKGQIIHVGGHGLTNELDQGGMSQISLVEAPVVANSSSVPAGQTFVSSQNSKTALPPPDLGTSNANGGNQVFFRVGPSVTRGRKGFSSSSKSGNGWWMLIGVAAFVGAFAVTAFITRDREHNMSIGTKRLLYVDPKMQDSDYLPDDDMAWAHKWDEDPSGNVVDMSGDEKTEDTDGFADEEATRAESDVRIASTGISRSFSRKSAVENKDTEQAMSMDLSESFYRKENQTLNSDQNSFYSQDDASYFVNKPTPSVGASTYPYEADDDESYYPTKSPLASSYPSFSEGDRRSEESWQGSLRSKQQSIRSTGSYYDAKSSSYPSIAEDDGQFAISRHDSWQSQQSSCRSSHRSKATLSPSLDQDDESVASSEQGKQAKYSSSNSGNYQSKPSVYFYHDDERSYFSEDHEEEEVTSYNGKII